MSNIPEKALERLKTIQTNYKIPMEELMSQLQKEVNSEFMQNDPDFPTQESKIDYISRILLGRYQRQIPYTKYDIIGLGIGKVITTKSGQKRGNVYVASKQNNKLTLDELSLKDKNVEKINNFQTGVLYQQVSLGKYKNGGFSGDERTVFENPVPLNVSPLQILDQLQIKRCKISDAHRNLARQQVTSTGTYNDRTDWRIIRGIIVDYNTGISKNGNEWAYITFMDESLEDDYTTPDGLVVKKVFTAWVNPMWITYEKDNEIDFVGPITEYEKNVSMEAYLLLPVHTPFGEIQK